MLVEGRAPVIRTKANGFESRDVRVLSLVFSHTIGISSGYVSRMQTSNVIEISLFRKRCKINNFFTKINLINFTKGVNLLEFNQTNFKLC